MSPQSIPESKENKLPPKTQIPRQVETFETGNLFFLQTNPILKQAEKWLS
jgi:hypothetical protein